MYLYFLEMGWMIYGCFMIIGCGGVGGVGGGGGGVQVERMVLMIIDVIVSISICEIIIVFIKKGFQGKVLVCWEFVCFFNIFLQLYSVL